MFRFTLACLSLFLLGNLLVTPSRVLAQEQESQTTELESDSGESTTEKIKDLGSDASEIIEDKYKELDENEQAKEVSAGILQPIYQVAEMLAFPAFHWIAFAVMATGVVSYALQLVLGKLVVLSKMSLSISEILSDALGFVISAVGLVLTTQAAAENSTFTTSPAAVISASAVGVVAGFVFYLWGQAAEVAAVKGRKEEKKKEKD